MTIPLRYKNIARIRRSINLLTYCAGTGWENTELRSYEFADPEGKDSNASLKETSPSWRRRRGSEIPLTRAEQVQLQEAYKETMKKEHDAALRFIAQNSAS